ncbi:hypothetical protein M0R45_006962 [Rubus argutus]|uniref:Uncharacterized protein n=1 Tax=Rubus argutus TaxID=59490 RepID=A0AAW1YSG1_RUBAR
MQTLTSSLSLSFNEVPRAFSGHPPYAALNTVAVSHRPQQQHQQPLSPSPRTGRQGRWYGLMAEAWRGDRAGPDGSKWRGGEDAVAAAVEIEQISVAWRQQRWRADWAVGGRSKDWTATQGAAAERT